jgi:outer membrane lipoprotein-sorting protein
MHGWKASLTVILAILCGPPATAAEGQDRDPASELQRLSDAIEKAKTEARFEAEQTVYAFSGDKTVVTRFRVRYVYPYQKRETIEGPEESRFVMLEDGKYQWTYFPARKLVVKKPLRDEESSFPLCPAEDLSSLMQNYRFQVLGPVPAEGMQCRIVSFTPKSGDRPRREWWLEDRWNVPVRVNVTASDGRPAYIKQLGEIQWNVEPDPDAFRLMVPKDTRVFEVRERGNLTIEEARRLLGRPLLLPAVIPPGYRPHDVVLRIQGPNQCLQIIYSDGLSSFSLFQAWPEKADAASRSPDAPPADKASLNPLTRQHGLMNVVTLPLAGPDQRAVLVGDLQQERLIEMAESIRAAIQESLAQNLRDALQGASPPPP